MSRPSDAPTRRLGSRWLLKNRSDTATSCGPPVRSPG